MTTTLYAHPLRAIAFICLLLASLTGATGCWPLLVGGAAAGGAAVGASVADDDDDDDEDVKIEIEDDD